jgi:uncharacterized protein YqeY
MKIRDRINADLIAAMKAQAPARLSVLRMMKAAVKLKEVDLGAELEDAQAIQVLSSMIKQRRDSIEQFGKGGRNDLAEKEAAEIPVIEEYLPAAVTDDEIAGVIDEVVRESGASSARDIGPVMKQCMARFAGKLVDGKNVNALVRARLENN